MSTRSSPLQSIRLREFAELIETCVRGGWRWRVAHEQRQQWQRLYLFVGEKGWSTTWCEFPPGSVLVTQEVAL